MRSLRSGIEFIVAIPSYMEADTIPYVTKQVDLGLTKYFGNLKSIILNVDNNSEDDTKEHFFPRIPKLQSTILPPPKELKAKEITSLIF